MRREIKIIDRGKDCGYGRYALTSDDDQPTVGVISIGTNDANDIHSHVIRWLSAGVKKEKTT